MDGARRPLNSTRIHIMTLLPRQIHDDRTRRIVDGSGLRLRPAILRGDTLYWLPRPVTQILLHDSWDQEKFKTLLVEGDTIVGSTRNGVDMTITGVIGSLPGEPTLTPDEMFAQLAELRSNLHVGPDDDKYRLFLIHDAELETYRFLQSCTTAKLEVEVSNLTAFRYQAVIHAEDPAVRTALDDE